MMKLEDFVRSKREEADLFIPSDNLWKQLEAQLPAPQKKSIWPKLGWVAALVFCLGLGYFWGKNSLTGYQKYADIKALDPQYAKQMVAYDGIITERKKILTHFKSQDPALYATFGQDWKALETSYEELRKSLPNHPNQEELLKAMIENLRWQAELLERQVQILEQVKSHKSTDEMV